MPSVKVFDMAGKEVSSIELSDAVFGVKPNKTAMHTMVVSYLAAQRHGTQSALTRSEVSGGGKKPWRQKGTGRARHGSTRSPQWKHGGVVFAPKPRDYRFSVNKKVKRLAMKSALSSKLADNDVVVLDGVSMDEYKTKTVVNMLAPHLSYEKTVPVKRGEDSERDAVRKLWKKALVVLASNDRRIIKSAANIPGIKTAQVNTLCVYDILNHYKLIIVKDAVANIEEVYA
jgi:large subunit ribosomal protein L4